MVFLMDKVDFWLTSGWHLLKKDSNGKLIPTKDFMKAYFSRPEVEIVEDINYEQLSKCLNSIKG